MNNVPVMFDLSGKAAFVAGASSGIGLHVAQVLAAAGAAVALGARRADRLQDAVKALAGQGHRSCAVNLDVTVPETIAPAWAEAQAALGQPIDILFNNAGIIYIERFVDQDPAEVARIFDTNLKGAFLVAQEAARSMAARKTGSIINVTSSAGLRASGQLASYGASKAGLVHLTHIMALELGSRGVRVNALAPGNFRTDMHGKFQEHGFEEAIGKRIPMRRFGEMDDLDGITLLLASDASRYITGAVIPVDGGQTLSWM
ncbi:SDR family NAD(P)-dependent oxidoreductase [Cupriavidus sp. 2TAF22]|uniref:SDR family NAD(P)-dependent oxidoreductase n=1 Tax=unclassified Cupriavidus TaxID=2640874 RepID=UPI003F8F4910